MSDDQQEGMRTVDGEESVRMNQSPGYKRCLATQHPAACALRQVTVPVSEAGNVKNNDCQTASGSTRVAITGAIISLLSALSSVLSGVSSLPSLSLMTHDGDTALHQRCSANINADQKQNAQSPSATQFSCTQHAVAALILSFVSFIQTIWSFYQLSMCQFLYLLCTQIFDNCFN